MTRVLVTGASGFVGRRVIRHIPDGIELTGLVGRSRAIDGLGRCDHILSGDILDEALLRDALGGVDVVCHLAATIPTRLDDPGAAGHCLEVNACGALLVARLAAEAGVERVVHISTANLYSGSASPATENDSVYPSERASYYLGSKLVGEIYVEHVGKTRNLPVVVLRLSSVYGPGMPSGSVVAKFLTTAALGGGLRVDHGGVPTADFVHVDDVAGCIVAALFGGDPGIYNVGSGQSRSVLSLATTVVRVVGRGSVDVREPQGPVPAGFPALDVTKARTTWDYCPIGLEEGLERTVAEMGLTVGKWSAV